MIQELLATASGDRQDYYLRIDGTWRLYSFQQEKDWLLRQIPQSIEGEIIRFPFLGSARLYAQILRLKATVCSAPAPKFLVEISPSSLSDRIILANRRCCLLMGGQIVGFSVRDFLVAASDAENVWRSLRAGSAEFLGSVANLDGQIVAVGLRGQGYEIGDVTYAIVELLKEEGKQ